MTATLPAVAALTTVHSQRLAEAVKAAMRGQDIAFVRETTEGVSQMVWYDGNKRHVILRGERETFTRMFELARIEFTRQLTAALSPDASEEEQ